MSFEPRRLPTHDDVVAAATRIEGKAVRTPLLSSPVLDDLFGGRILFKAEVLQRTGSFKFRGAWNVISALSDDERRRGIIAYSSGNHAYGVAVAASMFGARAVIVMPSDAPAAKIENVRSAGGEVVLYDRYAEEREIIARPYVDRGMVLVPPFDHPGIIAGQGTIGLEVVRQASEMGLALDALATPCGGGGLASGIGLALSTLSPDTEIWGVEPENFDDTRRSLAAGRPVPAGTGHRSICDAILTPQPGELTFAINRTTMTGCVAVSDRDALAAVRLAARQLKLVVEPGGAVALAALISGAIEARGRTVAIVLSGGNIDPAVLADALLAERI